MSGLVSLAGRVPDRAHRCHRRATALGAAVGMLYTFVLAVARLARGSTRPRPAARAGLRTVGGTRLSRRGDLRRTPGHGRGADRAGALGGIRRHGVVLQTPGTPDGIRAATASSPSRPDRRAACRRRHAAVAGSRRGRGDGVRRTSVIVPTDLEAQAGRTGDRPAGLEQTRTGGTDGKLADCEPHRGGVDHAARTSGWKLGDDARCGSATAPGSLRVVAIYDRGGLGDVTLHAATLAGHTATGLDDHILIRTVGRPGRCGPAAGPGVSGERRGRRGRLPASWPRTGDKAWLNKC